LEPHCAIELSMSSEADAIASSVHDQQLEPNETFTGPETTHAGHIGHIVEGRIEIEFKTGVETFSTGEALFILLDPCMHRAVPLSRGR
jgi:hypothetical protein